MTSAEGELVSQLAGPVRVSRIEWTMQVCVSTEHTYIRTWPLHDDPAVIRAISPFALPPVHSLAHGSPRPREKQTFIHGEKLEILPTFTAHSYLCR
jgi:hypothetical protein